MTLRTAFIQRSYQANIWLTFVRTVMYNLAFFLPTWVVLLQQVRGLSLTEVVLVEIAVGIAMVTFEVPTGAVADVIGRKASLLIGSIGVAVAAVWFGLAPTLGWIIAAHVMWGIALTFNSGADLALFYESLQQLGREGEYVKLRGQLSMMRVGAAAVGSILGGFIANWHLSAPFLIYGFCNLLGFVITLGFLEPPARLDPDTGKRANYREALQLAYQTLLNRPALRALIIYAAVTPAASYLPAVLLIQPYALEIGIPLAMLGMISFGYQAARFIGASTTDQVQQWLGTTAMLKAVPVLLFGGLFALFLFPSWLGIGLSLSLGFVVMVVTPVIEFEMLKEIPDQVRATLLSVNKLFYRAIISVLALGIGLLGDWMGLRSTFLWAAILVLILLEYGLYRWLLAARQPVEANLTAPLP